MNKTLMKRIAETCCTGCVLLLTSVLLVHLPVMNLNSGFSIFLMIVGLVILFFGGIFFYMVAWTEFAQTFCRCQPHIAFVTVPPFLMFVLVAVLTVGNDSPLPEYMIMTASPALQRISICDWSTWNTSETGVYFRDGVLTRSGKDVGGVVSTVKKCTRNNKGHWLSCQFGVRPIFRCDSALGTCQVEPPCAWAVTVDGTVPAVVPCGENSAGGVCGFVASFPVATAEANAERKAEMSAAIQKAAMDLNVSYSGETPMVKFANPTMAKDGLYPFYVAWWCVTIFYTVVPAIFISIGFFKVSKELGDSQSGDCQSAGPDNENPDFE
eukprot:TRINITY_DN23744_c0_g2_i4.p1 TRINITY_DN23744_c0_g2~~TRINITY_DN23744_c0_g2_i4.p1  ORF type:complete len:345 (+),score=21.95 TRINITY_DN23744_c0_g2_i4:65-1036(+)